MSWVLFYDGDCGFCNKSVRLVHRMDKHDRVDFALLQGELSASLGLNHYAAQNDGTVVLLRETDGAKFFKSEAIAELGKALGGRHAFLGKILSFIPLSLRNWIYDWIAERRYFLAGKNTACGLPDENFRLRMRP